MPSMAVDQLSKAPSLDFQQEELPPVSTTKTVVGGVAEGIAAVVIEQTPFSPVVIENDHLHEQTAKETEQPREEERGKEEKDMKSVESAPTNDAVIAPVNNNNSDTTASDIQQEISQLKEEIHSIETNLPILREPSQQLVSDDLQQIKEAITEMEIQVEIQVREEEEESHNHHKTEKPTKEEEEETDSVVQGIQLTEEGTGPGHHQQHSSTLIIVPEDAKEMSPLTTDTASNAAAVQKSELEQMKREIFDIEKKIDNEAIDQITAEVVQLAEKIIEERQQGQGQEQDDEPEQEKEVEETENQKEEQQETNEEARAIVDDITATTVAIQRIPSDIVLESDSSDEERGGKNKRTKNIRVPDHPNHHQNHDQQEGEQFKIQLSALSDSDDEDK
jgi:cob(I)alamin adenosyltransferase